MNITNVTDSTLNINIEKTDKLTLQPINGVGFKIQVLLNNDTEVGWLSKDANGYIYDKNFDDEYTVWRTGDNGEDGKVSIPGLSELYRYVIYEVETPFGYDLQKQIEQGMTVSIVDYYNNTDEQVMTEGGRQNPLGDSRPAIKIGEVSKENENFNIFTIKVTNIGVTKFSINIEKRDLDGSVLNGAIFKIKVLQPNPNGSGEYTEGWLGKDENGYIYNKQFTDWGIDWETQGNGIISLPDLDENNRYIIYETKAPDGYDLTQQIENGMTVNINQDPRMPEWDSNVNGVKCLEVSKDDNGILASVVVSNSSKVDSASITIDKRDADTTSKTLSGAEFKIEVYNGDYVVGWLVKNDDGTYNYRAGCDENGVYDRLKGYNEATVWTTDKKGKSSINNLNKAYIYKIYETKPAEGYATLEEQIKYGMIVKIGNNKQNEQPVYDSDLNAIFCTSVSMATQSSSKIQVKVFNSKYSKLKIKGYVWEDVPTDTKQGTGRDNQYDSKQDILINDITVSLMDSSGNQIGESVKTSTQKYKTKTQKGVYVLNLGKRSMESLYGCYIKFEFNAGYYVVERKIDLAAGSKADSDGKIYINSYNGGASFFETSFYDEESSTLYDMNLGLAKLNVNPEIEVEQKVDHVRVNINGYTYEYSYLDTGDELAQDWMEVSLENGKKSKIRAYIRYIYPSDIIYSKQVLSWEGKSLQVFITYQIIIKNPVRTQYLSKEEIEDAYKNNSERPLYENGEDYCDKEKWCYNGSAGTYWTNMNWAEEKFVINKEGEYNIINTFDANKYTLVTQSNISGLDLNDSIKESFKKDVGKWKKYKGNDNQAIYTGDKITLQPKDESGDEVVMYMTLQVKNKYLEDLLDGNNTGLENEPTTVNVKGQHIGYNYSETSHSFRYYHPNSEDCDGHDQVHYRLTITGNNQDSDGKSSAYGMKIQLDKERTITGIVFRDEATDESKEKHEVVGDGKYDNENVVQGAKVELIQRPDTNKVKNAADHVAADHIDTYPVNSSEPIHYVESNENGEYKLIGVVPGEYYVRFTYGDGSQKIVDPSSHDEIDNDVSIRKYKSTIITEEKAIEEIKNNINNDEGINNTDVNWYRNIGKNYSIAHDDLTIRQTFNESASGNVMKAYTPFMNIKIENDDKEKHDVKSTSDSKNIIEYINFGIINIPKIELGFEKNITNIKLVNGQLNTIVNGNPVNTASMKYVSNLSNRNLQHLTDGGDRIKIEIADNEIYGTKLEITYTLTVINNSEINYSDADGSYYLFGDKEGATEESITIEEVRDYLDKKLIFENGGDNDSNSYTFETDDDNNIKITGSKALFSQLSTEKAIHDSDYKLKLTLLTTHMLANTEEDRNFNNWSKIMKISITGEPPLIETPDSHTEEIDDPDDPLGEPTKYTNYFTYDPDPDDSEPAFENPSDYIELMVVPPTGAGRIITYICIIVLCGAFIATGIVIIKKKVI